MQISVPSALSVFHDGQFWVGLAERVEDGRCGVARIVFGAEPPDEEMSLPETMPQERTVMARPLPSPPSRERSQ